MGFKKHGVGEVTETESADSTQKTASTGDWTEADQAELDKENER